jgi:hypothetical protein
MSNTNTKTKNSLKITKTKNSSLSVLIRIMDCDFFKVSSSGDLFVSYRDFLYREYSSVDFMGKFVDV